MRQSLESRLAAAEMLRKAAELEKLEKEESAKLALLEQEAMMEKVVQESRRLQQEAEENSKVAISLYFCKYERVFLMCKVSSYLSSNLLGLRSSPFDGHSLLERDTMNIIIFLK